MLNSSSSIRLQKVIKHILANVGRLQSGGSAQTTQQTTVNVNQLNRQVLQSIEELQRGFQCQLQLVDKGRSFPGVFSLINDANSSVGSPGNLRYAVSNVTWVFCDSD
jgi:hypothetical protein